MGSFSSKVSHKDRAILDLKVQRDKLKVYAKKISIVCSQETQIAKQQLSKGNKTGAIIALKKKKYQENLLTQTENQLLALEELTSAIEFALVEQQVIKGLEAGNATLKALQAETSLDAVQTLMDETQDAITYQNQIDHALSTQLTESDQAEIEAELDAIIDSMNAPENDGLMFPKVPSTALPSTKVSSTKVLSKVGQNKNEVLVS